MDVRELDKFWDDDFDPMCGPWDGTRVYGADESADRLNEAWKRQIAYALPAAANMILEACDPMRYGPAASPEEALCAEALTLAAFASWMGVETKPVIAATGDIKARTMVLAAAGMSKTPSVGDADADQIQVQLDTKGSPLYAIWDPVFGSNLLASAAASLPNGTKLDRIAYLLDMQALGSGRWREAAEIIEKD